MTSTTASELATQVYQVFIKATPEQIWDAITKPEYTTRYFHGGRVETTGEAGTPMRMFGPDGATWGDEIIEESDPPRRLVVGWRSRYNEEMAAEPRSRIAWEIEPRADGACLVTLVHDQLEHSPLTAQSVSGEGWMGVLSGLKTLPGDRPADEVAGRPRRMLQSGQDADRARRIAIAVAALAAGTAPAATPRLAIVDCDDAAARSSQPGGKLYGARLGFSWGRARRSSRRRRTRSLPFWSKLPIFMRAGGRAFTIAIAPSWHGGGDGLGQPGRRSRRSPAEYASCPARAATTRASGSRIPAASMSRSRRACRS